MDHESSLGGGLFGRRWFDLLWGQSEGRIIKTCLKGLENSSPQTSETLRFVRPNWHEKIPGNLNLKLEGDDHTATEPRE